VEKLKIQKDFCLENDLPSEWKRLAFRRWRALRDTAAGVLLISSLARAGAGASGLLEPDPKNFAGRYSKSAIRKYTRITVLKA
jgi:hypothetical protein